jgi:ATP-binding cassette subfamily F protein 3
MQSLSGGQKSRVAFAVLCGHEPNFLVLDEPTNHLDIQTIEALGNALIKYKVSFTALLH